MQEVVSRQLAESPAKVMDPQIELLVEMGREADLDSRPAQVQKQQKEQEQADSKRDDPEPEPPAAGSTPEAVPQLPESTESLSAVAASPPESHASFPDAALPVDSAAAQATPSEVFISPAAEASPETPAASQASEASPSEPVASAPHSAEPSRPQVYVSEAASPLFSQEEPAGQVDIDVANASVTETVVPDALPVDFEAALKMAQNTIELPRFTAGDEELIGIMDSLPELPEPDVMRSTAFAEQKLSSLSRSLRQWGRFV